MHKRTIVCCLLLLAPALTLHARAQDTAKAPEAAKAPEPPTHYYRLEFVIQELGSDGKPSNSRTYSTTVSTGRNDHYGAIRTGARVPIITGALHGPTNTGESKLEFQYQYLDVGVSIDTENVHENGGQLSMLLKAEVSSLADPTHASTSELPDDPVIRQNSWQASVLIPIGKPTVVFASDALESKGGMQLSMTATRLD
jgi:hypothetical protein